MMLRFLFLIAWLCLCIGWGEAQTRHFDRLNTTNGLSHNTVNSLTKDSLGYVWIGTEDGLNRFDGLNTVVYRHQRTNTNGLSDSYINSLCTDADGVLWVGTMSGGLNMYDARRKRFRHFRAGGNDGLPSEDVRRLYSHGNYVWVGCFHGGPARIHRYTKKIERIELHGTGSLAEEAPQRPVFVADSGGNVWVGTSNAGLFELAVQGDSVVQKQHYHMRSPWRIGSNSIHALALDHEGKLLVLAGNQVYQKDSAKNQFRIASWWERCNISSRRLHDLVVDRQGRYWVASAEGLYEIDPANNRMRLHQHDRGELRSLSHNYLLTLMLDAQDILWVGTNAKGVNRLDLRAKAFELYRHSPSDPQSLNSNLVRSICVSDSGAWIGTVAGGVDYFDTKKRIFVRQNLMNPHTGMAVNFVSALHQSADGYLWVGTWREGVYKVRLAGPGRLGSVSRHVSKSAGIHGLSDSTVQAIFQDKWNRLFVSTENGLNWVQDNIVRKYYAHTPDGLPDNRLQSAVAQDTTGNLWLGTWGGLARILPPRFEGDTVLQFRSYKVGIQNQFSLADNRITALCVDHRNRLWIGSYGGGLSCLQSIPPTDELQPKLLIQHLNTDNGLPNNMVYGIKEDKQGRLWVSTNNGLSCYDPETGRFRNYEEQDGLQNNQFYWGMSAVAPSGLLFFGGVDGLNVFDPLEIKDNQHPSRPQVNKIILFHDKGAPSELQATHLESITLPQDANSIKLELSALHFSMPNKNRFRYQLQGQEQQWQYTEGVNNTVSYTNLSPGTYRFVLYTANGDGIWNASPYELPIVVLPKVWQTWWFQLVLAAGVLLVVLLLYLLRVRKLQEQTAVLEKRVQERTLALDRANKKLESSIVELSLKHDQLEVFTRALRSRQEDNQQLNEELSQTNEELHATNDSLKHQTVQLMDTLQNLREAQQQLVQSEKMAALGILTAGVAHEINNPINFINSSIMALSAAFEAMDQVLKSYQAAARLHPIPALQAAEELAEELNLDFYTQGIPELFNNIDEGIRRSAEIVRSLRYFSHHDAHQKQSVDVHQLLDSTLVMLHHQYKNRIRIEKQYSELPYIQAFSGKLSQVFMNVLSNAIQAISGPGNIRIATQFVFQHNLVEVHIHDSGPGIPPEHLAKIFDPFFTTKAVGQGSGLGLSISYDIVREHGGSIHVESPTGEGAHFIISLPLE